MADKALGQAGVLKVFQLMKDTYAPIDSPVFTGVPTAETVAAGTSTPQIATTEFVMDTLATGIGNLKGNVDTYADLPTDPAPTKGDVYQVVNDSKENEGTDDEVVRPSGYYKWNGTEWEPIEISPGGNVEFLTDEEIEALWDEVVNPTP